MMLRGLADLFGRKKTDSLENNDAQTAQEIQDKPAEHCRKDSAKTDWTAWLAEELGISGEEAQEKLDYVERDFGIKASVYCMERYFEMSEASMATKFRRRQVLEKMRREKFAEIKKQSGKGRKQIREELIKIRHKDPGFKVDPDWSYNNGAYMFDPDSEEMEELMALCRRKEELSEEIKDVFRKIDRGEAGYESIEGPLEEFRQLTEKTLSGLKKSRIYDDFENLLSGMDERTAAETVMDIELTYQLLGFSHDEYRVYHFRDKTLSEKREYVSSELRAKVIAALNTQEGSDLLNDKYGAYCRLSSLYGREAVLLDSENGPAAFREFCGRHSSFVRKNNYDSLGRGIARVDVQPGSDSDSLYEEITADCKRVLLEELISPCPEIKRLNPDSVNTVRVITFLDGGEPVIQDAFMKIGRKGSFIDNGGAGGIFVHVDPVTGAFDTGGVDETGAEYESHPDHGYAFRGIELPDWSEALKTAKAAALMVPEARYIGWDLTRTDSGKWIVVEGNAKTQFFAQQMTRGRGVRKDFLDSVHFDADTI